MEHERPATISKTKQQSHTNKSRWDLRLDISARKRGLEKIDRRIQIESIMTVL